MPLTDGGQDSRFREIHERISDAFYALDEDFRFTYVNERAEELLQADAEDLLGERVWDEYPEAVETDAYDAFHEALETQESTEYELYYEPLDFWVNARVYPSETGLSIYFRDVSERKERERQLRQQRERLAALNHLNDIVRDINRTLVQQSTRDDIEDVVCTSLAESDSYQFAWVGTVDERTAEVVPRTVANDQGYLDSVTITADDSETGQGPTGTAIRTGELHIVQGVADAPEYEPWSDQARERGFSCSAAIPVQYDGEVYGVLNIYTTRENAFDEEERAVIRQLGEIMGLAITVVEYEQEIRENEQRYRTLAENIPNGAVILYDTDLQFRTVAGTIYDELPIDPSDLRGNRVTEVDAIPSDVSETLQNTYRAALDGDPQAVQVEYSGRLLDIQAIPVRNDGGDIVAGMTLSQDITERRNLERTYRDIFEHVSDGLVIHDAATGEILNVNKRYCEMNDYGREELVGETVDIVTASNGDYSEERARELIRQARREGPQLFEWRNQRSDGTAFPVEVSLSVVEIRGQERVLASVRDISERKRREEQLEHERERLEFLNRLLRHNLLNGLNVVRAHLSILEPHTEPEGDQHLETVHERTDDMIDLIQTLRSLMQFISEDEEHELERVDLVTALRKEVEQARQTYDQACFEIRGDVNDVAYVMADDLLREVFENLLVNAVQHNDADTPRVAVEVETDEQTVTVHVTDNGPGIPDEMKDRIFEKGEKQFESSGTGFGLYLAREIINGYGGSITVADNDPSGAVFSVTLPRK